MKILQEDMLELRHLKTLVALREHGSLVAAAGDLCLTPSALSHQLREIDQWFGVEVVNRRSRPVSFSMLDSDYLNWQMKYCLRYRLPKVILLVLSMDRRDVLFSPLNVIAALTG